MSGDEFDYGLMIEGALRGVVRQALQQAADRGLSQNHHFYIAFKTQHPGVDLPSGLQSRYPDEMTVVLQHRFWDLQVGNSGFEVTLTFNDKPAKLGIPYAAIIRFADPSVDFDLRFGAVDAGGDEVAPEDREAGSRDSPADGPGDGAEPPAGAEVVSLDHFRKKR